MLFWAFPPPYLIIDLDYYFFLSTIIYLVQDMLTIMRIGRLRGELALLNIDASIFFILNSCIGLLILNVEIKMLLVL